MKQELDPVALKAAITHARGGIRFGLDDDVLITAAIRTYQKTECKPFKDALDVESIRDGAPTEVFNGKVWWTLTYREEEGTWHEYPLAEDFWPHGECLDFFSHHRIPFNPKAPGD